MNSAQDFESVAQAFLMVPGVSRAKMFGSPTLKTGSKVFACLFKGTLVVKLPADRVSTLIASGMGRPFDPGMGRIMKEWVVITSANAVQMRSYCDEARAYVNRR